MRIPYGFVSWGKNLMAVSQPEAEVVNFIFDQYLHGQSLGGIVKLLEEKQITSPTRNPVWGRAAVDKLLSNGRYVPHIISFEKFNEVQFQKDARCNIDYSKAGAPRKERRYCSQSVLTQTQMGGGHPEFATLKPLPEPDAPAAVFFNGLFDAEVLLIRGKPFL